MERKSLALFLHSLYKFLSIATSGIIRRIASPIRESRTMGSTDSSSAETAPVGARVSDALVHALEQI